MTSCASVKTEYIYVAPDVVFPIFPEPNEVAFDENTGIVSMPLEYYLRIAEYKRDVDKVQTQIERINELYKKLDNGGSDDKTDAGKTKKMKRTVHEW